MAFSAASGLVKSTFGMTLRSVTPPFPRGKQQMGDVPTVRVLVLARAARKHQRKAPEHKTRGVKWGRLIEVF